MEGERAVCLHETGWRPEERHSGIRIGSGSVERRAIHFDIGGAAFESFRRANPANALKSWKDLVLFCAHPFLFFHFPPKIFLEKYCICRDARLLYVARGGEVRRRFSNRPLCRRSSSASP